MCGLVYRGQNRILRFGTISDRAASILRSCVAFYYFGRFVMCFLDVVDLFIAWKFRVIESKLLRVCGKLRYYVWASNSMATVSL